MDPAQLANYRSVSNLSFLSKLLERSVSAQTTKYFNDCDMLPPLQSAYRPRHLTEITLIKISNDAVLTADQGIVVILLDYSAAFDTVDHDITFDILENKFGRPISSSQHNP